MSLVYRTADLVERLDPDRLEAFLRLFSLRTFFTDTMVKRSYEPPSLLANSIALTEHGQVALRESLSLSPDVEEPLAKVSVFLKFYHHNLYVDLDKTDIAGIESSLNEEIVTGRYIYPWIFERALGDKYIARYGTYTESMRDLAYDEAASLLQGTPMGVFQLHDYIVGPFGMLRSLARRWLPPLRAVFVRCADPSCNELHSIPLDSGENKAGAALDKLQKSIAGTPVPARPWSVFHREVSQGNIFDDMYSGMSPVLLANAFSTDELRIILRRLLEQNSIRDRLPTRRQFKDLLKGSPSAISARLDKPQSFQLALLQEDAAIVRAIEDAVDEEEIRIPPTEIRSPVVNISGLNGWFDVWPEVSTSGVRFIPRRRLVGVSRTKRLIQELYREASDEADLEWKLRNAEGEHLLERLDSYVRAANPRDVLREFAFASRAKLSQATAFLRWGSFKDPQTREAEEVLLDKMLWKVGFNTPGFPSYLPAMWTHLERLLETVRQYTSYGEREREAIRGASASFFVSLEEVLEHTLAFSAWALLNDHYGDEVGSRFNYNLRDARSFMVSKLNGRTLGAERTLQLDSEGRNTLDPLIWGFTSLASLCDEILLTEADQYRRSAGGFPRLQGKTDLDQTPFLHTVPLLDIRKEDAARLTSLMREVTKGFERGIVAGIRNRLQHKREVFPTAEEIERACAAASEAVAKLETAGLCPNVYTWEGSSTDPFERTTVSMRDYRGRRVRIQMPTDMQGVGFPGPHVLQLIVPWAHIANVSEVLRFRYREESDFAELWRGVRISTSEGYEEPSSA